MHAIVQGFVEGAGDGWSARESRDVAPGLLRLYERGRAAHPKLRVDERSFGRAIGRSLAAAGAGASLDKVAADDLYLACACVDGVRGAAVAFEALYAKVIRRGVSRVLGSAADREEAQQQTRRALLVGTAGAPAKISRYLGHGSLENWVVVAAVHVAVSHGRSETAERRLREKAAADAVRAADPETLVMKDQLQRELGAAIEGALAGLEDRERLVLRLYLVSGMTLAAIGRVFGVSQPTVSRWLVKARKDVLAKVQRSLGDRLKLTKGDLSSMTRLVRSQLDINISRALEAA
jgi:RNA polymerase sigma-70 factor, ECF subfamily